LSVRPKADKKGRGVQPKSAPRPARASSSLASSSTEYSFTSAGGTLTPSSPYDSFHRVLQGDGSLPHPGFHASFSEPQIRVDLASPVDTVPELTLQNAAAQRLARTLLTRPEVLVADEPTASLDHRSVRVLEELVSGLSRSGTPVLWVTHDTGQLQRLADVAVVLVSGRVIAVGTPDEVRANQDVIDAYLGVSHDG